MTRRLIIGHMISDRFIPSATMARGSARWPGLLLALVLVGGFLLSNAHAAGHIGELDHADCEICLVAAGLDQAVDHAFDWPGRSFSCNPDSDAQVDVFRPASITAFRSRAPPLGSSAS